MNQTILVQASDALGVNAGPSQNTTGSLELPLIRTELRGPKNAPFTPCRQSLVHLTCTWYRSTSQFEMPGEMPAICWDCDSQTLEGVCRDFYMKCQHH